MNIVIAKRELGRLEFKSALKGIPGSTWETYSAFANTFGGRIILGIKDDTKAVEGVPNTELRIKELWSSLNNTQVVNNNILSNDCIQISEYNGMKLIIMDVPRADRYLRPIFYKRLETGTFKRFGEGDFHCTLPEIGAMMRDQTVESYDSTALEDTSFKDIDIETLKEYRNEMKTTNPDHAWNGYPDGEFLTALGAMKHNSTLLTIAGLLMFGKEEAIYAYFPRFKLDYREYADSGIWKFRVVTGDGSWTGNIFNFFSRIRSRIYSDLDQPLVIGGDMRRVVDTDSRKAVRECLLNSLIHADYRGDLTVKIEKRPGRIVISNSGLFRIPLESAVLGGGSDPRNSTIARMFSFIGLVERAGVGLRYTFDIWKNDFNSKPRIIEDVSKLRTVVELDTCRVPETTDVRDRILKQVEADPRISINSVARNLGMSRSAIVYHFNGMKEDGTITRVGGTRGRWEIRRT